MPSLPADRFSDGQLPSPGGVLYVDGEMPGIVLQERITRIVASSEREAAPGMFRIITPDMQAAGMPNLSDRLRNFVFRSHPISFLGATRFHRRDPLRSVSDEFFSFFHGLTL